MADKAPAKTTQKPGSKPKTHNASSATYESNPFTTAINGIKKLFAFNSGPLVGLTLFSLLLAAVTLAAIAAVGVAVIAFGIKQGYFYNSIFGYIDSMMHKLDPGFVSWLTTSLTEPNIYATWIIGGLLIIGISVFVQAMQLKLVMASVMKQPLPFGELVREGLRSTLPLTALGIIALLAVLAMMLVTGLLAMAIGPIIWALVIVEAIAALYISLRWMFACFAIVEDHTGPIAALRQSWHITSGHFSEIVGIASVMLIVATVPSLLLGGLADSTIGTLQAVINSIGIVVSMVVGIVSVAALAERYEQLRLVSLGKLGASSTHILNYLAPFILIVLTILLGALSSPPAHNNAPYDSPEQFFQNMQKNLEDKQNDQDMFDYPPTTDDKGKYDSN